MEPSRRAVVMGAAALVCTAGAAPAPPPEDAALFALLDAVGPFVAGEFHPRRALAAANALVALAPEARVAALRRYLAVRAEPPEGLFAVVRMLVEVPGRDHAASPFPGVLQPGFLRPPALGGPTEAPPTELWQYPHWPVVVLHDVPLVVVSGYELGGAAEPLAMHLDGLVGATWRTRPLQPGSAGAIRYDLVHWGAWSADRRMSDLLEAQLVRYEG